MARLVAGQRSPEEAMRFIRGGDDFPLFRLPDARLIHVAERHRRKHHAVLGSTGSGKSSGLLLELAKEIEQALATLGPDAPDDAQLPIQLVLSDVKAETAQRLSRLLAALYYRSPEWGRAILSRSVHSIEMRSDGITPTAPIARNDVIADAFGAELVVDTMIRTSRSTFSEPLRQLFIYLVRVLIAIDAPLNLRFSKRFLHDEIFRLRTLEKVPDADVRYYFQSLQSMSARQTIEALIRRIVAELSYPANRVRIGLPPPVLRALGLLHTAAIEIADFGPSMFAPPSVTETHAKWHATFRMLEATHRDPRIPLRLVIEEAPSVLRLSDDLLDMVIACLQKMRSNGGAMVLVSQSLDSLPKAAVRELINNVGRVTAYRSRADVAEILVPYLPAGIDADMTESERGRAFERDLASLAPQEAWLWVNGASAMRVRSLDLIDPVAATGLPGDKLDEIYKTKITPRSRITMPRGLEFIEEWEERVVGRAEFATTNHPEGKTVRGISDLRDFFGGDDE